MRGPGALTRHRSAAEAASTWEAYLTPRCRITSQASPGAGCFCARRRPAKTPHLRVAYVQPAMVLTRLRKRRRMMPRARRIIEMAPLQQCSDVATFVLEGMLATTLKQAVRRLE